MRQPSMSNHAHETTPLTNGPTSFYGVTLSAAAVRFITCIVSLAEGYDSSIFGAVANRLVKEFNLTPASLGMLGSILPVAMCCGAPVAGLMLNCVGRKMLLMLVSLTIAIGALTQALASTLTVLGIGRFIIGLGMGAGFTTVTVYVTEVSPSRIRGLLTGLEEIFVNVGVTLAFAVTWMLQGPEGANWRHAMFIGVIFPLIVLLVMPWDFTPESPRYLLLCGKEDEARCTMKKLGISDEEAEEIIKAWTAKKTDESTAWKQENLRPLLLAIGVAMAAMLTGISAAHTFLPYVLASKMPEQQALRWATGISALKFIILLPVCFYAVDNIGRKPLWIVSSLWFSAGAAFTALAFMFGFPDEAIAIGYGVILCSYSCGIGSVAWTFPAEILPTSLRGKGDGLALMLARIVSTIWLLMLPILFAWRAEAPFLIMAFFASSGCIFYATMCPETKQVCLENMQKSLVKRESV